ncbi:MAG TPA: mechanosensitive ion channel domain-containing protein [Candidatus Acidoferrales bacterium]|jgi:small-conductance mechanosensitive channel|nr:mechanosensitive ion channel domain-containing protein [Candidatus Acidoferrales bacterium]
MKRANKIFLIVLVVLVAATVYGLIRTGRESRIAVRNGTTGATGPEQATLVDDTPLSTAQALAQLPTTSVELPLAQGALQLGDQEMDLAFALAVLGATQHPPALSPEAKEIQTRLQKTEDALAAEQEHVTQLGTEEGKASGARKDALNDQLDLAKGKLELRQDEVDDAKQDLIRAGGDPQDRIQAMVQEHEAASQASDATKVTARAQMEPHGLIQHFQQWLTLHQKQLQLWSAKQGAISTATLLVMEHNSLGRQIGSRNEKSTAPVAPGTVAAGTSDNPNREESAVILKTTKRRADDRKTLATLDKRIDNEKKLADVYGQWIGVVAAEQRSIVNGGLRGVLVILAIAIIGLFVNDLIKTLLGKLSMDRRQVETLRTCTGVTLQIVGVLLVLLVIFGIPTQLGTVLGLAGAGLTVALKDFIIAFLGWFVLLGKNGIRLGDWVEINGVTGEVVDLGVFHTVLLETGNWTDSGHPTGRRVTFTNSYAVEGHYFNFSTSGQWLWDELKIVLPTGQNLYPIVDAIHKKVLEATSERARQAEQEWLGATKSRNMKALSAEPAINVKPVIGGTEISVRYITCANERSQLSAKLNHALVDLLGSGLGPLPDSGLPKPALTSE